MTNFLKQFFNSFSSLMAVLIGKLGGLAAPPVPKEITPVDNMRQIFRNLDSLKEKAKGIEGFDGTARKIDMAIKEAIDEISMFNERERIKTRQFGSPSARAK